MRLLITTVSQSFYGGHERGDIIAVQPDGAPYGRQQEMAVWVGEGNLEADFHPRNAHFAVIELDGEPPDRNLTGAEHVLNPTFGDMGNRDMVNKRAWRFDIDSLNPVQIARLEAPGGSLRLNRLQRTKIRRKEGNLVLPANPSDDGTTYVRREATKRRQRDTPPPADTRPDPPGRTKFRKPGRRPV